MALAKKYISLNGELVGEINKVEGTRTDYLTDALGSVVGTFTQEESAPNHITVLNTYRYKPYGATLATTGVGDPQRFGWAGDTGSRYSARNYAEQYNWHRHYGQTQGQWTSRDILWPSMAAFGYVRASPTLQTDRTGLYPDWHGCEGTGLQDCCKNLKKLKGSDGQRLRDKIKQCMAASIVHQPPYENPQLVDYYLDLISNLCTKPGKENSVCVKCQGKGGPIPGWNSGCYDLCKAGYWGYAYWDGYQELPPAGVDWCGLFLFEDNSCKDAFITADGKGKCRCGVVMCRDGITSSQQTKCAVFYHELAHCSGLGHVGGEQLPPGVTMNRNLDFIYKLGCCICRVLTPGNCGVECDRGVF